MKPNPSLTNAQCDKILATAGVHPDISEVYEVEGAMWRSCQFKTFEEANKNGAVWNMELCYGYTSALDSLTNMRRVADMIEGGSHEDSVRIILEIDGEKQPETSLSDADSAIDRHLIRKGSYNIL